MVEQVTVWEDVVVILTGTAYEVWWNCPNEHGWRSDCEVMCYSCARSLANSIDGSACPIYDTPTCSTCSGTGKMNHSTCSGTGKARHSTCSGNGYYYNTRYCSHNYTYSHWYCTHNKNTSSNYHS